MHSTMRNTSFSKKTDNSLATDNAWEQPPPPKTNRRAVPMHKTTQMTTFLSANRRLKDYELLAFACRRAGKQRDEGRAYFSMGILHDNLGKWDQAIEAYRRFLQVCKQIGDLHGEGLAYNCIGVDYQLLSEEKPDKLPSAIEYHKKHEEISDVNGKFLANINLGLCYDKMQDHRLSLFHYQNALKFAIKMSNVVGQSIAIGNIGKIGTKGLYENTDKMKVHDPHTYLGLCGKIHQTRQRPSRHQRTCSRPCEIRPHFG